MTYPHLTNKSIGFLFLHREVFWQKHVKNWSVVIDICHHDIHSGSRGLGRKRTFGRNSLYFTASQVTTLLLFIRQNHR